MKHSTPRLAAALALAALSFGACKGASHESDSNAAPTDGRYASGEKMEARAVSVDEEADGTVGFAARPQAQDRKIIRTGSISVVVDTYDAARETVEALVKGAGGYVDSTRVSHSEGRVSSASIVLRIPASSFGDLMPKLRALGEVTDESTDSADITAEYVDQTARLEAARALEKRLLELAANRTGTVADVLEVERELARVRGEIEHYEGMIRMWDDQVSMSTLTISLATKAPEIAAPKPPGFEKDASSALDRSVAALENAGKGLLLALISILPWLPLIIPSFLLGRRYVRRLRAALPVAVAHPMPMAPMPYPPPPPPAAPPPDTHTHTRDGAA
jgi:hypothetical protein